MGDIQVKTGQIDASPTSRIDFVGNLSADWQPPKTAPFSVADSTSYNMVKQSIVYDSLGAQHTVSQYFVKDTGSTVKMYYKFDDGAVEATTATLSFDAKGQLDATNKPVSLTLKGAGGAADTPFTIDYTGTTRFAGEATTTTNRHDGYPSGAFLGVELASDGSLVAKYSNDQSQVVGTLAIATFANEGALQAISDTSWTANADSGAALYNTPGVGLSGKLTPGALEGSNVDITSELVGLMTSQRNYQANSKVLTTESQMMQALMQAL
jgi:flagellar hook protein FlgE